MSGDRQYHDLHHDEMPPSAAGHLEPYGARVDLAPVAAAVQPDRFLVVLLDELAKDCTAAGATVIGHIKCLLYLPGGRLACSLTSLRTGARCTTPEGKDPRVLLTGETARLDLTVLVYGISDETVDGLVRAALARSAARNSVDWSVDGDGPKGGGCP